MGFRHEYNICNSSVNEIGNKPPPRFWHTSACFSQACFVFGGRDIIRSFGDLFRVQLTDSATWQALSIVGDSPGFRSLHSMTVINSNSFAIFGGLKEDAGQTNPANDLLIYSVNTNTWQNIVSPSSFAPSPRAGAGMASMQNQLVVFLLCYMFHSSFLEDMCQIVYPFWMNFGLWN